MRNEDKTRGQLLEELTGLRQKLMEKQEREDRFRLIADFTHDWEYWLGPGG